MRCLISEQQTTVPSEDEVKTTPQILRDAAVLIRRGWTQGVAAREADGVTCAATDAKATCWCLIGAVTAASDLVGANVRTMDRLAEHMGISMHNLAWWNDQPGRTAEEVALALEGAAHE